MMNPSAPVELTGLSQLEAVARLKQEGYNEINLYQEQKTERSLEALRDLSSPRALVIRDGERQRIAGREVVRGDLLVLSEGDRIPADAVLFSSSEPLFQLYSPENDATQN